MMKLQVFASGRMSIAPKPVVAQAYLLLQLCHFSPKLTAFRLFVCKDGDKLHISKVSLLLHRN